MKQTKATFDKKFEIPEKQVGEERCRTNSGL